MAKILLVEDDKSLREIYGVRLQAEGYDIVSAGDGEEALAVAIKERPDLIVSDVMMPKISGFDMLDILRSTTETKDIKVIMMTALSSEDQRARGEALGADRYLVKSQVGIEDVVRTVHDVLGDSVASSGPVAPAFPPAAAPVAAPAPALEPLPAPVAPAPVVEPTPEFVMPPMPEPIAEPVAPLPPAPEPAPVAAPVAPEPYQAPAPAPAAILPEPTAPFSSPRPASLGDRVINPLPSADSFAAPADIASQMNQELNASLQQLPPLPPAPEPTPAPAPLAPAPVAPQPLQAPAPAPELGPMPPQPQAPQLPPAPGAAL